MDLADPLLEVLRKTDRPQRPPAFRTVFACFLDEKCDKAGSASSTYHWLSTVRCYAERHFNVRFSRAEDKAFYKPVHRGLKKEYGCVKRKPPAFTARLLRKLHSYISTLPFDNQAWEIWRI